MPAEVLDANLVLVPAQPITVPSTLLELFEREDLARYVRGPLSVTAGFTIDASRGQHMAQIVESMRSQITVSVSPSRLQIHDRSGNDYLANRDIVPLACALAETLGFTRISAAGANYTYEVRDASRDPLARQIAQTFLRDASTFLPAAVELAGAAVRLFCSSQGIAYNLAIEPRLQDRNTTTAWISCNAETAEESVVDGEQLRGLLTASVETVRGVIHSVFPALEVV